MPVLKTQTSSKPRLENDTLGDQALKDLYRVYEEKPFEEFRLYAECVVKARFELGEPILSRDTSYSFWYAQHVIKGKLPEEWHNKMMIFAVAGNIWAKDYIKEFNN